MFLSVGFQVYLLRRESSLWVCGITPDWEVEAQLAGADAGEGDPFPTGGRLLLTAPLPLHLSVQLLHRVAGILGGGGDRGGSNGEGSVVNYGGIPLRTTLTRSVSSRRAVRLLRRMLKGYGFPAPEWAMGMSVPISGPAAGSVGFEDLGINANPFTPPLEDPFRPEDRAREAADEERVLELLTGRLYRLLELEKRLDAVGEPMARSRLVRLLHRLVLQGKCGVAPGVALRPNTGWTGWVCGRCGATEAIELTDCASCGLAGCPTCTECSALGPMRGCEPCYMCAGNPAADQGDFRSPVSFTLPHALTPAQADASDQLRNFLRSGPQPAALVWAVCGAGKTEVAFAAVEEALSRGRRVLFAIPRRSVVAELAPRLRQAFPDTPVEVAYGGAPVESGSDPMESGGALEPVVLATTHQALRLYRAFDLVVLDEVDAFPYRGSRMLRFAVRRAARPGARLVLMTATPDEALLRASKSRELAVITIPARHHGHPLPVPALVRCRLPTGAHSAAGSGGRSAIPGLPNAVFQLLRRALREPGNPGRHRGPSKPDSPSEPGGRSGPGEPSGSSGSDPPQSCPPVLLFVPTVALADSVRSALRNGASRLNLRPETIESVHAGDSDRDGKVERLRQGRVRLLVTTSILERGMTVSNVNVVVLFSDFDRVFSVASLIQMAGRSGRSRAFPGGWVWFVGRGVNRAMKSAVRAIEEMNEMGRRQGYLDASEP